LPDAHEKPILALHTSSTISQFSDFDYFNYFTVFL